MSVSAKLDALFFISLFFQLFVSVNDKSFVLRYFVFIKKLVRSFFLLSSLSFFFSNETDFVTLCRSAEVGTLISLFL